MKCSQRFQKHLQVGFSIHIYLRQLSTWLESNSIKMIRDVTFSLVLKSPCGISAHRENTCLRAEVSAEDGSHFTDPKIKLRFSVDEKRSQAGQVKFLCCTGDDFMTYCASIHGLMKSPEDAFREMCSCFDPTAEAARSASTETTGQTLGSAKRQIKPSESQRSCSFTSLNSGLSVFFFTAVLCFDFLFSSGFRYLQQSRDVRQTPSEL